MSLSLSETPGDLYAAPASGPLPELTDDALNFAATNSNWSQVDTGALSWLIPEIHQTLEQSLKCLNDFSASVAAASPAAGEDVALLRMARSHLHQAHGALQVIDLEGVSLLTEAVEQLYDSFEAGPAQCTADAVQIITAGFHALNEYLEELMDGALHQPMRLFPSYSALLQLKGAERIHASDLFFPELSIRPPQPTGMQRTLTSDEIGQERVRFEGGLLRYLRNDQDQSAVAAMTTAIAAIEASPKQGQERAFWWITRAFFEALKAQALPRDEGVKRLTARINLQIRRLLDQSGTSGTVSERVLRDTLFFVAQAQPVTEHIRTVKRVYRLEQALVKDYEVQRYGHMDMTSIRQAKDLVAPAKKAWTGVVSGNLDLIPEFAQHTGAILNLSSHFGQTGLTQLALVIANIATDLSFDPRRPDEQIGLDVASALLFMESALDQIHSLDENFDARAMQVVARLDAVAAGLPADEEISWLDEMTRKAHERQAMEQFIAEMRGNLGNMEKSLDAFFRNPAQREGLAPAEQLLGQLGSALAALGHEPVLEAVANARQTITRFADPATVIDDSATEFQRLAHTLSAIGFYVDHILHPSGKGMNFRFDEQRGHYTADLLPQQEMPVEAAVQYAPDPTVSMVDRVMDGAMNSAIVSQFEVPVVETTLEQQTAESGDAVTQLAEALRENPDDVMARDRLLTKLEEVRINAELIDNPALRENASAVIDLLESAPEEGAVLSDIMANISTGGLANRITELATEANRLSGYEPVAAPVVPSAPVPEESEVARIDAELLEIFLGEAQEVLQTARTAWASLNDRPDDQDQLVTIRRAFHTLKGSGRMVGLNQFGEAAWAVEQTLNQQLSEASSASAPLLALLNAATSELELWVGELQQQGYSARQPDALVAHATAVREGRVYSPGVVSALVATPPQAQTTAPESAPPLKLNIDFDLDLPKVVVASDANTALPITQADALPPEPELPLPALAMSEPASELASEPAPAAFDNVRQIGHLTIGLQLYNIFLAEADELLRKLARDFGEWRHELHRTGSEAAFRAAHSLAGSSSTLGLVAVHDLASAIERVLLVSANQAVGLQAEEMDLLDAAVNSLRAMLHRFAAQFLPDADLDGIAALDELRAALTLRMPAAKSAPVVAEPEQVQVFESINESIHESVPELAPEPLMGSSIQVPVVEPELVVQTAQPVQELVAVPAPAPQQPARTSITEALDVSEIEDDIDAELMAIFIQEANDYLPQIGQNLRDWQTAPARSDLPQALLRQLHTVKGSARMAGAMRLGELMHAMETRVESAATQSPVPEGLFDDLLSAYDFSLELLQQLAHPEAVSAAPDTKARKSGEADAIGSSQRQEWLSSVFDAPTPQHLPEVERRKKSRVVVPVGPMVRVRADLLDRVVNQAGEVSITRARLDNEIGQIRLSLGDLTDNLARLRSQLREIEMQAESQMQSQLSMAKEQEMFDPLEFDRFTRFQELTRMMAESVNDVEMVRKNLMRSLDGTSRNLSTQKRMTRDMQQDLMRVRMVPFSSVTDRLYRVVRQASKELDKRANLDIVGSNVEMDRALLEQMAGPFEHLLRNAIVHGIESREQRRNAGKAEIGELLVEVRHEGNEIVLTFSDDGAGLNLPKIRERGLAAGLITEEESASDERVSDLIFQSGLSTASAVTELAGRGVGMDVVRQEATALGGRVTVSSQPGQGSRFTVHLPLTLAVTQAVVVRAAGRLFALPAVLVDAVQQVHAEDLSQAYLEGHMNWQGKPGKIHFLARLLGEDAVPMTQRLTPVLMVRSSGARMALHVDEVLGNQEAVVKNLGPQLARMAGISGATVLGSGEVVLILNPIQIAQRLTAVQAAQAAVQVGQTSDQTTVTDALVEAAPQTELDDAVSTAQAFAKSAAKAGTKPGKRGDKRGGETGGLETMSQVMVVDDSLTVRRVTQRLLMREGYQVVLAKDGIDALQQMEEMTPDVMLVDIEMPRMDGFDLTRHIREDERYKHIPIIMITSRTADKHRTFAMQLGVNVYLGKPYQDDELLGHIRSFVEQRKTL